MDQAFSSDRYQPSIEDVLRVKDILMSVQKSNSLPIELVDNIIDHAEYWPHSTTTTFEGQDIQLRSLPVGYIDSNNPFDDYQILSDNEKMYPITKPTPWANPHDPDDAPEVTADVLNGWKKASKPRSQRPVRKIIFTIRSHDQGWGGNNGDKGTFAGSCTWFEVGLERLAATRHEIKGQEPLSSFRVQNSSFEDDNTLCTLRTIQPPTFRPTTNTDTPIEVIPPSPSSANLQPSFVHPLLCSPTHLQRNRTATRTAQTHKITWSNTDNIASDSREGNQLDKIGRGKESGNGEFVRQLRLGDTVTVWAKARFPGWVNIVESAKIDVFWAV